MTDEEFVSSLLGLLAGPSMGVVGVWGFVVTVLRSDRRSPAKGWLAFGGTAAVLAWCIVGALIAAPRVFSSWSATGPLRPDLVVLSATWLLSLASAIAAPFGVRSAFRYLKESYRPDERPAAVQLLDRLSRRNRRARRVE